MFLMYCLFTFGLVSLSMLMYYPRIFIKGMIKPKNQNTTTVYYRFSHLYFIIIVYGLFILFSYLTFSQFPILMVTESFLLLILVLLYFINRKIGETLSPETVSEYFTSLFSGDSTYGPEIGSGGNCGGDGGGAGAD
ncbi:hypothetical protein FHE72_01975 [Rossellomorea vietnamensis]|uniref:Uncharacterized protein n=1 Tax=Rossellomorea vietnamensis TaxID=218284 RepID=A0A6I6ULS9_9BACI|nr:hypothetical protein [Rossellomorea vietnamensis]QHE59931.1 hypothetical protein FHE72_01975 [Rossellomorea vietnamensis]